MGKTNLFAGNPKAKYYNDLLHDPIHSPDAECVQIYLIRQALCW